MQYLQKLQNKGMRIILRSNYRTKIKDMHEALNFMSIRERIEYNVCILIHKMIMGECPNYLKNKVELVEMNRRVQTRQKDDIHISRCKTKENNKKMLHNGFKMYNFILK